MESWFGLFDLNSTDEPFGHKKGRRARFCDTRVAGVWRLMGKNPISLSTVLQMLTIAALDDLKVALSV